MHFHNETNDPLDINSMGATIETGESISLSDFLSEDEYIDLFEEIEKKVKDDLGVISLYGFNKMSKSDSLKYIGNYTIKRQDYRIYDHVHGKSRITPLGDIDYKVSLSESLFFAKMYRFGREIRKIGYWYNDGIPNMDEPVILIDYNFSFDPMGLVSSIEKKISYYKHDGSIDKDVKTSIEFFDFLKKGAEQRDRREYIYREIVGLAQVVLVSSSQYTPDDIVTIAGTFVAAIDSLVGKYIEHGIYDLVDLMRKTVAEIQVDLSLPDLSFLDLVYSGGPFKDEFVRLLDYRQAEVDTSPNVLYSGSLIDES